MGTTVTVHCPGCGQPVEVQVAATGWQGPDPLTKRPGLYVTFESTRVEHPCVDPTKDAVTQDRKDRPWLYDGPAGIARRGRNTVRSTLC